jgi:hypothetical protein
MNSTPTNSESKYISSNKRYGGKMLSREEAIDCYKTIRRIETAIAIPIAEYVNQYETKCIRDVGTGLNYTNNLLTPAEALSRIQDIKEHIQFMRWGPWRPDLSDWAIMDLYEQQIERLKKDLKTTAYIYITTKK